MIQDRFLKADDNMTQHIKDQLRKIAYLETTYLKPPSQSVKIKSARKKVKLTHIDNSMILSPSYFEHVGKTFFRFSNFKISKKMFFRGARISKPFPSPTLPKVIHIDFFLVFMHKYIERIVDVKSDDNCGYLYI